MSKPIYVGCAILDLSKLTKLQFHYKIIEKQVKHQYSMIYSDTDSFVYNIQHPDIYDWMQEHKQYFDLSYYKRDDMHDDETKNKRGCFKDELNGCVMSEWLGLNPKYYSLKYQNIEKKQRKGVSKAFEHKLITFKDYENT